MIIAVDFDNTLAFGEWPEIGTPNTKLIKRLIKDREEGNKIILWTCRCGSDLEEAVAFCKNCGLEFDGVNASLPEKIVEYGGYDSRKIDADIYIDDRCMSPQEYMGV